MKVAREMLPHFQFFRLEDRSTEGIPDISADGMRFHSWWEVKLADPDFTSKENQDTTLLKLEVISYARYIIYELDPDTEEKVTRIVRPQDFKRWKTSGFSVDGWDHRWVVNNILRAHASKGQTQF